ncbi:Nuclear cap-binding protein subunit 1 [Malassezia sp. CBS 17886]|nr:Nuclear cap-binding protein subunit 1 [Malassezia sp. CBS 17886]
MSKEASGRRGWARHRGGPGGPPRQGRGDRFVSAPAYLDGAARTRAAEEDAARPIHRSLFQLGDVDAFDPTTELPRVAQWLASQEAEFPRPVLAAFRIMATEQPQKATMVAALAALLAQGGDGARAAGSPDTGSGAGSAVDGANARDEPPSLGVRIVDDLAAAYAEFVDAHYWRNARLVLALFAELVPAGLVSASSLRDALLGLAEIVDGGDAPRRERDAAVVCIADTLCRAGTALLDGAAAHMPDAAARVQLDGLVARVAAYVAERPEPLALVRPFERGEAGDLPFLHDEGLDDRMAALHALQARDYRRPAFLPSAEELLPQAAADALTRARPVHIPRVSPPPQRSTAHDEPMHMRGDIPLLPDGRPDTGKGAADAVRERAGPAAGGRLARWFDESTPSVGTPASVVLRALVEDMVDLYVANRKECAQQLLALPHWLRRGTFDGAVPADVGLCGKEGDAWSDEGAPWSLDDVLVETILSAMLQLPTAPQNGLYYASLLREVVSAAPQRMAPSLGRTMRRLYAAAGHARIPAELLRRLADWFSVHLSNFNFTWAWPEWAADAARPWTHARRAFARRLVELEVRLAYYDRVKSTLPPELQDALLAPEEALPVYTYEHPDHVFHARAMQLLQSVRAKASAHVVQADLRSLQRDLVRAENDAPGEDEDPVSEHDAAWIARDIAVQTLLNAGSRSFSHLLNVIERYHELLRALSTTPEARRAILASATRFWARSAQWVYMVVDKLLQYRIVDPVDVVAFVFDPPREPDAALSGGGDRVPFSCSALSQHGGTVRDWSSFHWWLVLCLTVDKVVGRVRQLTERMHALDADAARAQAPAGGLPADAPRANDAPAADVADSDEARVHLHAVEMEQRKVLATILSELVALLRKTRAWDAAPQSPDASEATWQAWWLREWYRMFVTRYHDLLAANRETMLANAFASVPEESAELQLFREACHL